VAVTDPDAGPTVDPERFREVLGHFASGVTIVTAATEAGPVGFTCQAFTSLSLEPPMVALAPGKQSTSWPRIAAAGAFCVNILAADQAELCRAFAVPGSVRADKFAGVAWRPAPSGAPLLDGVHAWVDCRLLAVHEAGDHELVLGRVVDLGVGGGEPLVFHRGRLGRLDGLTAEHRGGRAAG
jgi:3-hydroxy-9,10-secoandrosta-1,3,5(10)-triene-9,17-dione monooxygenase reductase component